MTMLIPFADLTATATLILAGITFLLVLGTVALVLATRAGTAQARVDTRTELRLLERQIGATHRPLLVDVIATAPVPEDMGALYDTTTSQGPNATVTEPGPVIETKLPGIECRLFDPRTVFVLFQAGKIYLSAPLRNVGRGLAVITGDGIELAGPLVGAVEHQTIQRHHVPVGETTRIDLIAGAHQWTASVEAVLGRPAFGIAWQLTVPYCDFAGQQRTVARLQIVCRGEDVNGPWLVERVDQESPLADGPVLGELPAASSAEPEPAVQPINARRQQVTDIWGKPITPRRRRR
jgi:hypothetical protein